MAGITEQQAGQMIQLLNTIADQNTAVSDEKKREERKNRGGGATSGISARDFKAANEDMASTLNQIFKTHAGRLDKFSDKFGLQMSLVSKSMVDSIEQMNYDQLQMVPEYFRNQLDSIHDGVLTDFKSKINSVEDIELLSEVMVDLAEIGDKAAEELELTADELAKVADGAAKLNMTQGQLLQKLSEGGARALHDAMMNTSDAMEGGAVMRQLADGTKSLGVAFAKLKVAAAAVAAVFMEIATPAMRFGVGMETLDAALSGMSTEDFAALQAEYRQSIAASGKSLDDFQETIMAGSMSLVAYTGDLSQAVRIQAQAANQARLFGATTEDGIASFMNSQVSAFQKLNKSLSMTSDQFLEMNAQLQDSAAVSNQIYRLNEKQRAAYYKDLMNTYEKLRTDGLLHEQALRVVEALEQIKGKDPRERMKDAARMRAVMGAMGMGDQGARAQQIMLKGSRASAGETAELAEIMKQANQTVGDRLGAGLGSEMATYAMIQKTGLENYLGPESAFADLNKQSTLATDKLTDTTDKLDQTMGKLVGYINALTSAITGPLGKGLALLTGAAVMLGGVMKSQAATAALGSVAGGGLKAVIGRIIGVAFPMIGALLLGGSIIAAIIGAVKDDKEYGEATRNRQSRRRAARMAGSANDANAALLEQYRTEAKGKSEFYSTGARGRKRYKTDAIEGYAQERARSNIQEQLNKERETIANTNKNHEELTAKQDRELKAAEARQALLEKQLEALDKLAGKVDETTKKVEGQTEEQKKQHEENKKRSSKNTRLIWTPAAG